ncbi:MAG: VWA domain-containing protein, partial [Halobacteriovoraceae bacterium]|nr:VWA domain-containing protein [Halobacteriovoraceae bacterium]
MNFNYSQYLPIIIILIIILFIVIIKSNYRFFNWVEKYWFYKRSPLNKFSSILYLIAISLFLLSLLDLRGPEKKQSTSVPDQKTIIILDSSASMMVEDVRPNRFQKGIIIARHFIKKALGHQIAIVLFSDTQKKLIPFTDDIDLLDARINGLKDIKITKGGSNISQAVLESLQYFKAENKSSIANGNILLITDSEEHEGHFNLNIPESVALAVVGVGTKRGGPIPSYDNKGNFVGHKKYQGEKIISKLNEDFLKSLSSKVSNYKYWIALSYNIPTEEIIIFFKKFFVKNMKEKDVRIKPVLGYNLIIWAIIFLSVSILLNIKKRFIIPLLIMISHSAYSQIKTEEAIEQLQKGKLDRIKRLKLAEKLLKEKKDREALILYEENVANPQNLDNATLFNYATAQLKNRQFKKAFRSFLKLEKKIDKKNDLISKNMKKDIKKNILLALRKKE